MTNKKAGRPKRQFSKTEINKIRQYALNNSKSETIASALDIPVASLKRHFGRKMTIWRAEGKVKLKDIQRKMTKHSTQMAIWLGKQDLDQTDKQTISQESTTTSDLTPEEQRHTQAAIDAYKASKARADLKVRKGA